MTRLSLCGLTAALFLASGTPLAAQTGSPLPQGDGRDLTAAACSQCHNLNPITAVRESVELIRRLWRGDRTPYHGKTFHATEAAHFQWTKGKPVVACFTKERFSSRAAAASSPSSAAMPARRRAASP